MSNHLAMDKVQSVRHLHSLGWSQRKIARTLGIDRKSVRRQIAALDSKGTTTTDEAPTGLEESGSDSKGTKAPTARSTESERDQDAPEPLSAEDSRSDCKPYRAIIEQLLEQRLSAKRIFQDLVADHGFAGSYWSVNRFVRRLQNSPELPFRRMEVSPGEEAQIDFGTGAPYLGAEGKKHRCHVLRVVLSFSRKAYSEVVPRQTTECFIRAIENAFHAFGGVPRTLVIDNLKAAVTRADWFDPELNPKIVDFCKHYSTSVLPTKPYTPRHKGKVERGVAYVQDNALKGRVFQSLAAENAHIEKWERSVADTRIHGTTKQHVGKHFDLHERAALQPLPTDRFPFYHEAKRVVSRDGHIEVAKSYYSVAPEYVRCEVWARWDTRTVRVFNERWQQVAFHTRVDAGKYSTSRRHIANEKISGVERGTAYLLGKASKIGPCAARWAEAMVTARGIEGTRVLQGLLALTRKHSSSEIEAACDAAWRHQCFRLRAVRRLIENRCSSRQATMDFIDEHPLIRSPEEYAQFVHDVIQGGV